MIDDSICYLLHDMMGYSYHEIGIPVVEENGFSPLYAEYREAVESSLMAMIDFIDNNPLSPVGINGLSRALHPVPAFSSAFCTCGEHINDPYINDGFKWLAELTLNADNVQISFRHEDFGIMAEFAEEFRRILAPNGESIDDLLALRPNSSALDNIIEGSYPIWNCYVSARTTREGTVHTINMPPGMLITKKDLGADIEIVENSTEFVELFEGLKVLQPCINQIGQLELDFQALDPISFFALFIYTLSSREHIYGSVTDSGWEFYYDALFTENQMIRTEHHNATRRRNRNNNLQLLPITNLSSVRSHNENDCTICQEREVFSERLASESIRELVNA